MGAAATAAGLPLPPKRPHKHIFPARAALHSLVHAAIAKAKRRG
jgi:hypothetical protein